MINRVRQRSPQTTNNKFYTVPTYLTTPLSNYKQSQTNTTNKSTKNEEREGRAKFST